MYIKEITDLAMIVKRFRDSQKVVCVDKVCKALNPEHPNTPGVTYDEIYTIDGYEEFKHGKWWVRIKERCLGCIYTEDTFKELDNESEAIDISEIMEVLEECVDLELV